MKEDEEEQEILPITSDFFFEVFPFNIVFRQVIPLSYIPKLTEGKLLTEMKRSGNEQSLHSFDSLGHGGA